MPYEKMIICYMSGTGNSYRAAEWLVRMAENKGVNSRVVSIDAEQSRDEIGEGDSSLLGIVTPTHGFTAPWHMLRFVAGLPRKKNTHACCVATRAGMKFGPLFTPGISGSTTFIMALILAIKGYRVRGVMSLDMPSNWMSLHSGLHRKNVEAIIRRAESALGSFMRSIQAGSRVWLTVDNLYEIVWGVLLLPISAGYMIVGRFFLAKLFFADNRCTGCGICAENCPVNAIRMRGKNKRLPFWRYNCESCMRCMAFCPEKAVQAGHSWGTILYFIVTMPFSVFFLSWLEVFVPGVLSLESGFAGYLLKLLYFYCSLCFSYYIFSLLIRIPAVNSVFAYTTLTRIYRRYHEPDTRLKDMLP